MARVSISKAAKLAGISRSAFYKTYIEQGKITVSSDTNGKKYIDTSEILRVFGKLEGDIQDTPESRTETGHRTVHSVEVDMLKNQLLEAQRRELESNRKVQQQEQDFAKREAWYQSQITNLTDSIKLLEAPKTQTEPKRWWQIWK